MAKALENPEELPFLLEEIYDLRGYKYVLTVELMKKYLQNSVQIVVENCSSIFHLRSILQMIIEH